MFIVAKQEHSVDHKQCQQVFIYPEKKAGFALPIQDIKTRHPNYWTQHHFIEENQPQDKNQNYGQ
jgi:hypothetical protein